jgi:hypothetical protein
MNEETFKNSVVLPFLRAAGFDESELEFERTFTIQLGRARHKVGGTKGGRLDILCRRDATNLLVAELKAPSEPLDAASSRQAISYARLLEPMAPYVLVSNGTSSQLFDTITSQPIDRIDPHSPYRPDVGSELRLRYEALGSFVGYSLANLREFTSAHTELALRPFKATTQETPLRRLAKKYVSETFVNRPAAVERFQQFVRERDKSVLACLGDSGCGKTVLACYLQEALPGPSIFYSGTLLGDSLLGEIAADFNLAFSAQETELSILKRVARIANAHGARLVILVDAIDEWRATTKVAQLSRLAVVASQLKIKVLLTCKISHWSSFIEQRGVATQLHEHVDQPVLTLGNFTEEEGTAAAMLVTRFLDLPRGASSRVDESLRHPFTLRVVAEVAATDDLPLDACVGSRRTLKRFLELSTTKLVDPGLGARLVIALARRLLEHGSSQCELDVLRGDLGLRPVDELPSELFLSGLLLAHADADGGQFVSFYHSRVRDHVLAIMVARLSALDAVDRKAWVVRHVASSPGLDAILYFVATGDRDEQRDVLDALVDSDPDVTGDALPRLLSWAGDAIRGDVLQEMGSRLLDRLEVEFRSAESAGSDAAGGRVVDAIGRLLGVPGVESALVRLVEQIAYSATHSLEMQMPPISVALKRFDSAACTRRLVALVGDRAISGYVRRYIVASIGDRTLENREGLFLELVADGEPNVLAWLRAWYPVIEKVALRDELLAIHDRATSSYVAQEVCGFLGSSGLPDTAEALYARIGTSKATGWLCRALADLGYREAEDEFVAILAREPFSPTAANVVIAMSEMPSSKFVSPLIQLILHESSRLSQSADVHFYARALARCASAEDLAGLADRLPTGISADLAYAVALTLQASSREEFWGPLLAALADGRFGDYSASVLSGFVGLVHSRGAPMLPSELAVLEQIARSRHDPLSARALILLGVATADASRLAGIIRDVLPHLTEFSREHEELMWNASICAELRVQLDGWLSSQIRAVDAQDRGVHRWLVLAMTVGGRRTLEAVQATRTTLARATSSDQVDSVEDDLYRSLAGLHGPVGTSA